MIMDSRLEFCDAVNVFASAGTALVGSQIDTDVIRDLGQGHPLYLVITVATGIITGGTAGIIQFKLVSDSTASISTTTSTIHAASEAFVTDDIAAVDTELLIGATPWVTALPPEGPEWEQFMGLLVVTTTTTTTAGAINAFLTLDPYGWKSYADAAN